MKFMIRADASTSIGMGHVMRCSALGKALMSNGEEVLFITNKESEAIISRIENMDFSVKIINAVGTLEDESKILSEMATEEGAEWIILDGYNFGTEYQRILKDAGLKLLSIDDIAEDHFVSDIVLNQNFNIEDILTYSREKYTQLLLGTKYVLLRKEFRDQIGWNRKIKEDCNNILVTMGGSDPFNITIKVLKYLDRMEEIDPKIKVVFGDSFKNDGEISRFCDKTRLNLEVHHNVSDMVSYIQWCDVAISAAGSTLWELSLFGTPMIIGIVAPNQEKYVGGILNSGGAVGIGWWKDVDYTEFKDAVMSVTADYEERQSLSRNCSGIVDGKGVDRVTSAIYEHSRQEILS